MDEKKSDVPVTEDQANEVITVQEAKALKRESQRLRAERNDLRQRLEQVETTQQETARKAAEEQGNFKKLYEDTLPKLETMTAYEKRIKMFEEAAATELETIKKTLTEKHIELLNKLPETMTVEQRVSWARELAGAPAITAPEMPRPGGGAGTVEPILKEFAAADAKERTRILLSAKRENPKLFEKLLATP